MNCHVIANTDSDREIHTPPPQNRRSTSRVQNWGWCVFCLFLRFRQFAPHPPPKKPPDDGAWLAVPWQVHTMNIHLGFLLCWLLFLNLDVWALKQTLLQFPAVSCHVPPENRMFSAGECAFLRECALFILQEKALFCRKMHVSRSKGIYSAGECIFLQFALGGLRIMNGIGRMRRGRTPR